MRRLFHRYGVMLLLAACAVSVASATAPPGSVTISLKTSAMVNEPVVFLENVSLFPLPPLLALTPIAQAPAPGARMRIDRKRVRNAVLSTGRWERGVEFDGAVRVEVERKAVEIGSEKLWDVAVETATRAVGKKVADGTGFKLVRTGRMLPVLVPDKPYRIEAAEPSGGLCGGEPVFVRLFIRPDEDPYPVIGRTASFSVHWLTPVLVARKTVAAGSELTGDIVSLEKREITGRIEDFLREMPSGCRARRRITAGSAILQRSIEPLPTVEEGERVTAFWRSGTIHLSLEAKALEDGWPGSRIKVLDRDRRRILSGKVTQDGSVALTL